jgi:hypothetical protein
MSALAGKGEHVWTYVNLTHETAWFCASYVLRNSDTCPWTETMLLSSAEQVAEACCSFRELIKVTRLMLVSPGRMNETDDWLMEPLREIWCGRDPKHGDKVYVYALADGRRYVDSISAVDCSELQDFECLVSVGELEQAASVT